MARKDRLPVVFDTSLSITRFLRHKKNSINQRVINLWLVRRQLQLIISRPILDEYLGILEMHGAKPENLARLEHRLLTSKTVTNVNLSKRFQLCRDPNDNMFLDTAYASKAKFLISRDNDLLEIPKPDLRGLRFQIVSPLEFLQQLGEL